MELVKGKRRTGDIFIWPAPWWLQWLMPWAHMALSYTEIAADSETEEWYYIESGPWGVRDLPYKGGATVLRVACSDDEAWQAVFEAKKYRGSGYDWLDTPRYTFEAIRRRIEQQAPAVDFWPLVQPVVCHELVLNAYGKAGIDLVPPFITPLPSDVYNHDKTAVLYD